MSFLARRLAASEGAYFTETSKNAIVRMREKAAAKSSSSPSPPSLSSSGEEEAYFSETSKNAVDLLKEKVAGKLSSSPSTPALSSINCEEANADVLPEILQHSLPRACLEEDLKHYSLPPAFSPSPSSLAASLSSPAPPRLPRQAVHVNLDMTGLYAFLPNLPQASLGPRRWKVVETEVKMVASTANETRMEGISTIDEARAKALLEGYSVVVKAFLIATTLVVGGSSVAAGVVLSKSEIHSVEDLRTKGHEHMQPWAEAIGQKVKPWKQWVHQQQNRWQIADRERIAVGAPFVEVLGLSSPPVKGEVKEDEVSL